MRSKKIISMLAALSLAVSCFVGFAGTASAANEISVDFEDGTTNAFTDYSRNTISIVDGTGNTTKVQSVQQTGTGGGGGAEYSPYENVDTTNKIVNVSFDMTTTGRRAHISLRATKGNSGNRNTAADNRIYTLFFDWDTTLMLNNTEILSGDYNRSNWYHIESVVNTATKKVDLAIYDYRADGDYSKATAKTTKTDIDFRDTTATSVVGFDVYTQSHGAGVQLDNIKMSTEEIAGQTAGYTVKYQTADGASIPGKEDDTSRTGIVGSNVSITADDTAQFESEGAMYTYNEEASTSSATLAASGTELIVVFDKHDAKEIPVIATCDEEEIFTGTVNSYIGIGYSYNPRAYIKSGDVYYKYNNINNDGSMSAVTGTTANDTTISLAYTAMGSNVVYFAESGEMHSSGTNYSTTDNIYSDGNAIRVGQKGGTLYTDAVEETAQYRVTTFGYNQRGASGKTETVDLYTRNPNFESESTDEYTALEEKFATWESAGGYGTRSVVVTIPAGHQLAIRNEGEWNSNIYIDYILIEKVVPTVTAVTTITDVTAPTWDGVETFQVYENGEFVDADASAVTGEAITLYIKAENFEPTETPTVTINGEACQSHKAVADLATTINNETYFIYQFVGVDSLSGATVEIDGVSTTL